MRIGLQTVYLLKPDAIIAYSMGPRALSIFQQARVIVLKARFKRCQRPALILF